MVASESVQYFQFDQQGNMYIFEPGAGFSGNATLVHPGDDTIFDQSSARNFTSEQVTESQIDISSQSACDVKPSLR